MCIRDRFSADTEGDTIQIAAFASAIIDDFAICPSITEKAVGEELIVHGVTSATKDRCHVFDTYRHTAQVAQFSVNEIDNPGVKASVVVGEVVFTTNTCLLYTSRCV